MTPSSFEKEYRDLVSTYERAGGEKTALAQPETTRLIVHKNRVLEATHAEGIQIVTEETKEGVDVNLVVKSGARISHPVHLCFGVLPKEGLQQIKLKVRAEPDSKVSVIAHCLFPNAEKVVHKMDADIEIGSNACFEYTETHYHGEYGGIEVIPKAVVRVDRGGSWFSSMTLSQGLVGKLDYDFEVFCQEKAVAELLVKVHGRNVDDIKVSEKIHLNGAGARGLAKSRIVLSDKARAEIKGETHGNAPYARGHVDCMEIVNGADAIAKAIPIVSVTNDKAKVTHEAAIGSIDRKQVETLMARGLDENEAVDVIVKGILR